MKTSIMYKTLIGSFGLVLMFAYQNCSKVTSGLAISDQSLNLKESYINDPPVSIANGGIDIPPTPVAVNEPAPTSGEKKEIHPMPQTLPPTTIAVGEQNPTSGGKKEIHPIPPTLPPAPPTETCMMRPVPVQTVASLDSSESCVANKDKKDKDDDNKEIASHDSHGIKFCKEETSNKDSEKIDSFELSEALKLCDEKLEFKKMLDVDQFHGQIAASVYFVKQISNVYGSVILKGATSNSQIELISKIRESNKFKTDRTIVLCNFKEIALIENVRGHIVLVNSHVTELRDHVGRLTLVNSKIDKTERQGGGVVNKYASK
ncbi:MAG: hypothetical protein WA160_02785 [Pseudobdellovibrio sp.]